MKAYTRQRIPVFAGVVFGAFLMSNVASAAPWVSAPTSDRVDDTVTVSGGGMAPGAQLLLSLMNGQGQPAGDFDAEANASGNFSVNIPLSGEGGYLLEVRVVGDASDVPAAFMHLVPGTSQ